MGRQSNILSFIAAILLTIAALAVLAREHVSTDSVQIPQVQSGSMAQHSAAD